VCRRVATFAVAVFLLVVPVGSASAGGSWIDVTHGDRVHFGTWDIAYASAGSIVTMRGAFSSGQQAAVREGPWYGYLRPDKEGDQQRTEPMLLGGVTIEGDGYPYVARLSFRVPNVPTGYYWVDVCDLGCRQGVGDLVGGTIVLGATDAEARLFARGLILGWMHDFDVRRIADLLKRRGQLEAAIVEANDVGGAATSRARQANDRAAEAAAQVASVQDSLVTTTRQRDAWRLIGLVSLLLLLVAVAWIVFLRRRVRTLVQGHVIPPGREAVSPSQPPTPHIRARR
jgi:hypothetical protein